MESSSTTIDNTSLTREMAPKHDKPSFAWPVCRSNYFGPTIYVALFSPSPRPTSYVLEKLAFFTGFAHFCACLRGCIGLQCPQGPLDVRSDTCAFLVDRHALRG